MRKLKHAKISVVSNGYLIASVECRDEVNTYVFETFDNMMKWLDDNLEHPPQSPE